MNRRGANPLCHTLLACFLVSPGPLWSTLNILIIHAPAPLSCLPALTRKRHAVPLYSSTVSADLRFLMPAVMDAVHLSQILRQIHARGVLHVEVS